MARRALRMDPQHAAAIHVVVHVLEMQGRSREGLAFLAATESAWIRSSFSVHIAWHRALFHLENDDVWSALEIFDTQMAQSRAMSELADASALLWRLQLDNIWIGDRWHRLADLWVTQGLAGARPFYIAHAMMAFAAADRGTAVQRVFDLLQHSETKGVSAVSQEAALITPLCRALLAFAKGDYAICLEWMEQVRYVVHRCGGSLAQCDLIPLTFVEAAFRGNRNNLARALVAERMAKKPSSQINRRLQRRLARK